MPHAWILVPGFGSQGGTAADVAAAFDSRGLGAIVNNSRGIIFAHSRKEYADRFGPSRWQEAVEAAARAMIDQLRADTTRGQIGGWHVLTQERACWAPGATAFATSACHSGFTSFLAFISSMIRCQWLARNGGFVMLSRMYDRSARDRSRTDVIISSW